jgi:molybdate transport system substrate-binding protein
MDYLAERGAIELESRIDLLGNRLVLIAPVGAARQRLGPDFSLDALLGDRPFAIADPDHVPAGIYAEAALRAAGLWDGLAGRTLRAANVRAALALVDRGEAGAGVVYATDAAFSSKVVVVDTFPAGSHPPIVYPLAIVAGHARPEVLAFYDYLRGAEAGAAFEARGFLPSPGSGS